MLASIRNRIYSDFFLPSRLNEYREMLLTAQNRGYEMHSIRSFWRLIQAGGVRPEQKYFINRHDIDTDLSVTRCMWEIEQELGVPASYYFRLSTLDFELMKEIEAGGSEASYHYEEIASDAKLRGYKSKEAVNVHMGRIQRLFADNLIHLRRSTGLPMEIVASHGDFVNRILGLSNHALLQNKALRESLGIELEVYDDSFMKYVTSRHSDMIYPKFYKPTSPFDAIQGGQHVIYFLSHPRHWRANPKENLLDDINRVWEGVRYKVNL
ncbi:hypothetical protein [Paenibacillus thalictri]|uniref:Uncharacterized protein n=1 Tax=Paenibacillus thalictri TaxID=2527873 RepID=A0A4Q9DFQ8_9BACL|nr:hypothetical protein [Paenibacillus thalictri]TBL70839.1 hypothetical protein EYB31_31830 [Paenibacillus thalictri]